jgi:hypothetical protein
MAHSCGPKIKRINTLGVTFLLCTECGAEWDYQDDPPREVPAKPVEPPEPDTSV